jgi:pimeloyl-ACP methyl ester carboxylesterase
LSELPPQGSSPTMTGGLRQPIVIIGGFLSSSALYLRMRDHLVACTGQPVSIVKIQSYDWLSAILPVCWTRLLGRLGRAVRRAARDSVTGKVTLVGHSAGGVLARLYLSPEPFLGRPYRGLDYVDHLITLGSPHYNRRRWIYGGMMSNWIEKRQPGAFFAPQVRYTSVAGKLTRGDRHGSPRERRTYALYQDMTGDGTVWGDGLIPVSAALLHGSRHIVLDGVGHFVGFGGPWYGADDVIPRWLDCEHLDTTRAQAN